MRARIKAVEHGLDLEFSGLVPGQIYSGVCGCGYAIYRQRSYARSAAPAPSADALAPVRDSIRQVFVLNAIRRGDTCGGSPIVVEAIRNFGWNHDPIRLNMEIRCTVLQ